MIWIALNLETNLGEITLLIIFRFSNPRTSWNSLFTCSLSYLSNILSIGVIRTYTLKVITKYFLSNFTFKFLFASITNTIYFCILIWYPVTLLNPLISSNIFSILLRVFYTFDPVLVNKDKNYFFLSNMYAFCFLTLLLWHSFPGQC